MSIVIRRLLVLFVAGLLSGCGSQNPTPAPSTQPPFDTPSASPDQPSSSPSATPMSSPSSSPDPVADILARPFTVLVIGGDLGWRTDALVVVGVDPTKRSLAFASIPRDTINVPLPGGGTFSNRKINAFYDMARKDPVRYPQGPARATADMVGELLGIHIDYFAATSFQGFMNLVRSMGGVAVNLPAPVVDRRYEVTKTSVGIRFPAGKQRLTPDRALIFVRTREGDSDFARQRRQQLFLLAAGRQVLSRPTLLPALLNAASNVSTNLPIAQIADLVTVFGKGPSSVEATVLGPRTYERAAVCSCGYALAPKLDAMRALAARFFPFAVAP
jgi:LCP family protein required for cell wall assembly